MKKMTLIIMILTIVSKILGFLREIVLSYYYGATAITDAYLISLTIPVTIFGIIGTGIVTSYIPVYSRIINEKDYKSAENFTNNLMNFILFVCIIVTFVVQIFTPQIIKVFASGFEGQILELTILFTRIFIFAIFFYSITYILNGYLQVNNNFIIPALGSIPLNLFAMISIALSITFKRDYLISLGTLLAALSQTIFLLSFAYKKGYRYKVLFNKYDESLKLIIYLALPVIVGISVNQINVLVDRTIASQIVVGGISALNYANRLILFMETIFVTSIITVMYPMISKMAAENNINGMKKSVAEAINSTNLFIIPSTVGAMIFAEPIVNLLFGRGAFDIQAISMTSKALFFYSIGMVGFGLREVLSRGFYSLQDTKTPMINATISMIMNIVLNLILSKYMGIGGLALATSISAIFCTGLLFRSLRKKIGSFGIKNISISFVKMWVSSLAMGIIAKLLYNILLNQTSANLSLIISIITGALLYFIIIYFMKIEEVNSIINAVKRKLDRSQMDA